MSLFCQKEGIGQSPLSEKEGIDQCPFFEKEGTDQCPLFHKFNTFFCKNLVCEKEGMQISVFYFSLYYNVNGMSMARRHWKIPSSSLGEKKFEFPTRSFTARGKFIFFALGFGGNFPIPPRHPSAILTL